MTDTPSHLDELAEATSEPPETALDSDRYGHLSLDDGAVVIYDRQEPDTWVQSDYHVEVGV